MKKLNKKTQLAWLMILTGLPSLWASFTIMIEKIAIAADPTHVPPCSINPFISCGPVMESAQASVFGFPNPFIGIIGFSIVTTIGFALLAGADFKKWFWQGLQVGLTFAIGFVYWLFFQAVYEIGALCTYCMLVWTMTIPLFLCVTVYNIQEKHLFSSVKGLNSSIKKWHVVLLLVLMYAVIIGAITHKFWTDWLIMFGLI